MYSGRLTTILTMFMLAGGSAIAQHTSLQIFQAQGIGQDKVLQVKTTLAANDTWFTPANPPASNLCNYRVYQVDFPDDPRMHAEDVTDKYLAYPVAGCAAVPVQLPERGDAEQQFHLALATPLKFGVRYLFTLRDPSNPNPDTNSLITVFTGSASLILEPQPGERAEVMISSNVWLKVAKGDPVVFQNKSDTPGKPDTDLHGVVERISTRGILVRLTDPLPVDQAGALQLSSKGLFDNYQDDIKAADKVTPVVETTASATAGQAPSITSARITTQFSATAAVHSTPTMTATGALAPFNQVLHMKDISRGRAVYFDPVVNFDVGTTNSKSANSVIVPSPLNHDFTLTGDQQAILEARDECLTVVSQHCKDVLFGNDKSTRFSSLNTSFGPREEFDTLYGGTNLMGELRLDLYPSFWYHTPASKKASIAAGNPAIRDLLQMPDGGWSLTPYLQYDGGRHVTAQNITNSGKNPAAVIPTYDISRLYLGLVFAGTYKSSSVNFDGSWFDLFAQETVPVVVSKVTYARSFSGWQPHFKGTYSLSLDPAKHFLLALSWEDGRSAPSFGYGNKATGGLQVVY